MTQPANKPVSPEDPTAETPPHRDGPLGALDGGQGRALYGVPVEVLVCVGKAKPPIGQLIGMRRDAVIVLDRRINDPVDIRVGDRVIARGELQELDDGSGRLGVRMTEIVDDDGAF